MCQYSVYYTRKTRQETYCSAVVQHSIETKHMVKFKTTDIMSDILGWCSCMNAETPDVLTFILVGWEFKF